MRTKTALTMLFLSLAVVAHAGAIYDNLYSATSDTSPVYNPPYTPPLFDSFATSASGLALVDVKLLLSGTPDTASMSVGLYDSNQNLLTPIGSLNDTSLSDNLAVFDFPLASPYLLTPNVEYWVALVTYDGSSADWAWSMDQNALGVDGQYYGYGTGSYQSVFPNTDGPYQMQVNVDVAPEPSALLLALIGGGILFARRRIAR